jgi:CelD/BcsL family acetyltransferase involved in cellulose biosynthesis
MEMTRATTLMALREADTAAETGPTAKAWPELRRNATPKLTLTIHSDLAAAEAAWRCFEETADCTAFQTFDWLAAWQRHVGRCQGTKPVIAIGRYGDGDTAFILPLAIEARRLARRLCWLGQEQCDYNAPLIARDFAQRVKPDAFIATWRELQRRLPDDPSLQYDWIELEKMPETIGGQTNPFIYLPVMPHSSGAYLTSLGDDWQTFYAAKRSSTTHRRDRAKRRHLSAFGDIRFVTSDDADDARRTLETLIAQKSHAFARKGIPDIFKRAGYRDFLLELAANPRLQRFVHISRVEIGPTLAAANFGLVFGGCYYHVLASYVDAPLAQYGPGALHLRELLAYAIGRGLKHFDFTIGDEPYKREWSDINLKLFDYTATVTWRGFLARWPSLVRRRVKRFIKQTPLVWQLFSRARGAVGAMAHRGGRARRGPPPSGQD